MGSLTSHNEPTVQNMTPPTQRAGSSFELWLVRDGWLRGRVSGCSWWCFRGYGLGGGLGCALCVGLGGGLRCVACGVRCALCVRVRYGGSCVVRVSSAERLWWTVRSYEQAENGSCRHPRESVFGAMHGDVIDAWCRECGQQWSDPDTTPARVIARLYELAIDAHEEEEQMSDDRPKQQFEMYEIQAYKAVKLAVQEERDFPRWLGSLLAAVCAGTEGGMSAIVDCAPKTYEREALEEFLRKLGCDQESQRELDLLMAQNLEWADSQIQKELDQ